MLQALLGANQAGAQTAAAAAPTATAGQPGMFDGIAALFQNKEALPAILSFASLLAQNTGNPNTAAFAGDQSAAAGQQLAMQQLLTSLMPVAGGKGPAAPAAPGAGAGQQTSGLAQTSTGGGGASEQGPFPPLTALRR